MREALRKLAAANKNLAPIVRSVLGADGEGEDWSFDRFWEVRYNNGEKLVSNTHPDPKIRKRFPRVKADTLYYSGEDDYKFANKVQKEFEAWAKKGKEKERKERERQEKEQAAKDKKEQAEKKKKAPGKTKKAPEKKEPEESPLGGAAGGSTSDDGSVADRLLRLRLARMRFGAY